MKKIKKLFSKEKTDTHDIYRIFGIKLAVRDKKREFEETKASKYIQDTLDLSVLQNSKKIIVYLTPAEAKINGGVMSIFSLCQATREIYPNSFCTLSTYPNGKTYVINDKFNNNEKVLRFDQIVNNAKNVQELILHIPDYYADDFYGDLNEQDLRFLKSVPNLQLNIMNQNIELMPEPEDLQDLYKLTNNITQTIAHDRYATQEVCNKWQMPTHLFSVDIDLSKYKKINFPDKEKIIVLSPDKNEYKDNIVEKIEKDFSDFKIITVQNMTFNEYMDLISRAYFTITFGEGLDGYFSQPQYVGSVGFAAYNDDFFPDESWKDLLNVYKNYDEMFEKITNDMKKLLNNQELYAQTINDTLNKINKFYNKEQFKDNLLRFYNNKYDFYPKTFGGKNA